MLAFILTAVVVIMFLGPVMMLRPSPLQKKQAKLRQLAAQAGLVVSSGRTLDSGRSLLWYTLPKQIRKSEREEWLLDRQTFSHEAHFYDYWDWKKRPQGRVFLEEADIKDLLKSNATDFYSLRADRMGVSVEWNERLNDNSPEQAINSLKDTLATIEKMLL